MKLVIANSRKWFEPSPWLNKSHEVFQITNENDLSQKVLRRIKPDFIFFPHWGHVVRPSIFKNHECILFHTAPLPYGRGGSPIQNLIIRDFHESAVCALRMTEDLDGGPIYLRRSIELNGRLTDILSDLNQIINEMILEIIEKRPVAILQKGTPTFFKRLSPEDNRLPENLSLKQLYDRIRMVDSEEYPSAFVEFGDTKIEFSDAKIVGNKLTAKCRITKC